MSAPKSPGQSGAKAVNSTIMRLLEAVEMKLPKPITKVNNNLSKGLVVKILGGLVLGTILLGTSLSIGFTSTDDPGRPPAAEETVIDRGALPDDTWMVDPPFYQDFSQGSRVKVRTTSLGIQDTPDDAWMVDPPFYQDFSQGSRVEVRTTSLGIQDPSDDAWMVDPPYYEDFGKRGS